MSVCGFFEGGQFFAFVFIVIVMKIIMWPSSKMQWCKCYVDTVLFNSSSFLIFSTFESFAILQLKEKLEERERCQATLEKEKVELNMDWQAQLHEKQISINSLNVELEKVWILSDIFWLIVF